MQTNSFDLLRRSQVYLKQAALKKGSSIEYVSENRIFTDADDYSMEIELPLADCPQNLDIFGMITRKPAVGDGPGVRGLKGDYRSKTSSGSIIIAFGQR